MGWAGSIAQRPEDFTNPVEQTDQHSKSKEATTMSEDRPERMMKWFKYDHLPKRLQDISRAFCELAGFVVDQIEPGPERTTALRKLLEAKDAAVRAVVSPGG